MVSDNTVDSFIRRIRVKLEQVGSPLDARHGARRGLHTEVMSEPHDDRAPSACAVSAPRSFRAKIVVSTVVLMAVAMLVVGLGIQLLLGQTAERDIDRVLASERAAR